MSKPTIMERENPLKGELVSNHEERDLPLSVRVVDMLLAQPLNHLVPLKFSISPRRPLNQNEIPIASS